MKGRRLTLVAQQNIVLEEFEVSSSLGDHDVLVRVHYSLIGVPVESRCGAVG
ncbi:MAG: hypothetical protein AB1696_27790 [Planctomycetota bacterium]